MNIIEIIEKKRDNGILNKAEMDYFIESYSADKIPDYQASALLMAIFIRGLNDDELFYLTDAMIRSGKTLSFEGMDGIFVDKHSTGGVGDKTSLVLGPILAACGLEVAKMSGRGLSFTGGTLDKLESIPGYQVNISEEAFFKQIKEIGLSIIGQSKEMVHADKKIYALRDVSGTVDSIPLIASSIMSKKIASGCDIILLDVKYGDGAFMQNSDDAIKLAETMIAIGKRFNKIVKAEITSMDDVLGNMIGNALEVKEAVDALHGDCEEEFYELCLHSACTLLIAAKKATTFEEAKALVDGVIADGSATKKLAEMIAYQGGDANIANDSNLLTISDKTKTVIADKTGYLNKIKVKQLGLQACKLGAGRFELGDVVDHSVGIEMHKKLGNKVQAGDVLCTVYYQKDLENSFIEDTQNCFIIEEQQATKNPLIYDVR